MYLLSAIYEVEYASDLLPDEYFNIVNGLPTMKTVYHEYSQVKGKIKKPLIHYRVRGNNPVQEFTYDNFDKDKQTFVWDYLQPILSMDNDKLIALITSEPQLTKRAENNFLNKRLTEKYWANNKFWKEAKH